MRCNFSKAFVVVLLLVSGCVIGPTGEEISDFGEASERAVAVIAVPDQLQSELALDTAVKRNTCRYIKGEAYGIGQQINIRVLETIVAQRGFRNALAGYAKALGKALDRDGLIKLRAAAGNFATASNSLAQQLGDTRPQTGPITNAAISLIVNVSEIGRIRRIREIMTEVYPYLIIAERRIEDDADEIDAFIGELLADWERQARCVLKSSRRQPATAAELFAEYDDTKRSLESQRRSVRLAADAIRKVKEAHLTIIESRGDLAQFTEELDLIVAQAQAIKDAYQN